VSSLPASCAAVGFAAEVSERSSGASARLHRPACCGTSWLAHSATPRWSWPTG
jgi:hypothetical protein